MPITLQTPTRRFLFLRSPRKAAMAPVYLFLLGLLAAGLLGLFLALGPRDSTPVAQRPVDRDSGAEGRSREGSYRPPPSSPKPRNPSKWM